MPRMDDDELIGILEREEQQALGYDDSKLAERRRKALEYYEGEPRGDELDGRSKVVSTDVQDSVEWILPDLIEVFAANDKAVVFEPVGPEDVDGAEQSTDYVNHIFYKDNDGFLIIHDWFKDALLQVNGFVKTWWDERTIDKQERYSGLNEMQVMALSMVEGVEVSELNEVEEEDGSVSYSLTTIREVVESGVKIVNVPPEEFLVDGDARTLDGARFLEHRSYKTKSELKEMFPDKTDVIDDLPVDAYEYLTAEEDEREDAENEMGGLSDAGGHEPNAKVLVRESYIRVDTDGDGITQLTQVFWAAHTIIQREEVDDHPFDTLTPTKMPHKIYGRSIYDAVREIQDIKTALWRNMLDNIYLANNGRAIVRSENFHDLNQLLTSRPGGIVELEDGAGPMSEAYMPIPTQPFPPAVFDMLEMAEGIRAARTGASANSAGIDNDVLKGQIGSEGVAQLMTAAQKRIKLIARVFAETGVKSLFRRILKLTVQHQQKARNIRLRNKWVPMDPRHWNVGMDMSCNVGLGSGDKPQQLATLMQMLQVQRELLMAGSSVANEKNVFNTLEEIAKLSGFHDVTRFFTDPESVPPQPPQPDPEVQKFQAEQQLKAQEKQADIQLKQIEMQAEDARERQRMESEREKQEREFAFKMRQLQVEIELKREMFREELALKRELAEKELRTKRDLGAVNAGVNLKKQGDVRLGGEPG